MEVDQQKMIDSWLPLLNEEFESDYFKALEKFLAEEESTQVVYPAGNLIFNAYNQTPPQKVKVVIIGQDPYHGPGQAHGLCFSVPDGVKPPPSLVNVFKELKTDLGIELPSHGNLIKWAQQGVFLLNATLTVRANQPKSHANKGWERFTDATISKLSKTREGLVFMLWGNDAKMKEVLIDATRHHVLKAAHPSPFSAYAGFLGCHHFSKANEILKHQKQSEIDWRL